VRAADDRATRATPPPRLVVPAYFHPAVYPDQWEWLAEHAAQIAMVVLNVANGPGTAPEAPFKEATERLHSAGVTVIGYVDTNYGQRPARHIMSELGQYQDWYQVSGVCLDRVASVAAKLAYYGALTARLRKAGADTVFFNHGAYPVPAYAEHADLLGTFEGPWPVYRQLNIPAWAAAWPADKFYHVVYSVPPERFGEAAQLAIKRNAASVYITERGGANPYDRLPTDIRN
jgi:hypothetical protein